MLVFLVDDDYEDHEIFKMALDKVEPSSAFMIAENGIDALEQLKNKDLKPDIIFLDINMPRMNGKECIRELRKISHLSSVPMILYSTHDGQKEITEAKEAGADDFITKPSSISAFATALKDIINRHVKLQS